jgi:GNAT superfamily N-acetyltransferase
MPSLEIHPLSELRGEAARLLEERYARQLAAEPLLPPVADFSAELPADGLVATRGGDAVAFLGGALDDYGVLGVGFAGCAAVEHAALADLFATLAEDSGAMRFAVCVPASDQALIDTWFRLAFGCQFIWGVRETDAGEPPSFEGTIRSSTPDDLDSLPGFDELLWAFQAKPPSFSDYNVPSHADVRADWAILWDDPATAAHFVAEQDGRIVGNLYLYKRPEGNLRVPQENVDLAHAATLEEVRGTGVGLALTHHALAWARGNGYRSMTIDWRTVNLLSSRFWPMRGFRPQYLRLYRAVP